MAYLLLSDCLIANMNLVRNDCFHSKSIISGAVSGKKASSRH